MAEPKAIKAIIRIRPAKAEEETYIEAEKGRGHKLIVATQVRLC